MALNIRTIAIEIHTIAITLHTIALSVTRRVYSLRLTFYWFLAVLVCLRGYCTVIRWWRYWLQLIVITHDERFAHLLGQREHAEYYWRVTKDDKQHSYIERETIYD